MVSQLLILLLLGAASQHGLGQEVAGLFASERLIGDKPVIDPLAVQYRAALQFAVHELAQCTEGSTRSYCALPLHLPANSSAVFPPPDETGNPLDMAKSVLRGSSVASPQVAVGTPNACLRTIAAAIMNTTLPFFQLPGIPESTLPDLQSPSLSGSMQQELMALHTVMTAATVHLVDLIVSDDMARVADEFRDFASAHSDPVVNRTILLRAGSGIQPSDRTRILDMVFPSEEPATPSPLENEEKYPSIVVLFVSEALAADVLELIAGRGTLGEHEVHLYTTVDVLRLLPSYGLAPVKIFSLRSTVSQFSDPVRAARPARAFAGTFLDYWTSLLKPGLDVRNRGSSVEPQPLAIDSQSPSELGDWYSDLMQLYGGTPPGIIVPGELFGVAPKIPGVTSEEIEEAHRANDFLYARTGREFVIDTRVTFALDTALTIAAGKILRPVCPPACLHPGASRASACVPSPFKLELAVCPGPR